MLTDTHCHFEDERYEENRDEIVQTNLDELAFAINVATSLKSFSVITELCDKHEKLFMSLGVHPHYALRVTPEEAVENIESFLGKDNDEKVVAIGECGLDYYWQNQDLEERTEFEAREAQAELFRVQIKSAQKHDLPIIIHCRDEHDGWDAYWDILEILKNEKTHSGVIHSFSGALNLAKQFVTQGFFLGISGIITFDKTGHLTEVVKTLPLENFLIETDAPYLTPVPHRGHRNEPRLVKHVAEKIAEIKEISVKEVEEKTLENARQLFGISV